MVLPLTVLRPPDDSEDFFIINIEGVGSSDNLGLLSIDWNKDIEQPTGTGTFNVIYQEGTYGALKEDLEIEIIAGWKYPNGGEIKKKVLTGYIKDVQFGQDTIQCDFNDKGVHLERKGKVSWIKKKRKDIIIDIIKKAELIPRVTIPESDDIIDYNSESSGSGSGGSNTGTGAVVTGTFKPSCGTCSDSYPYEGEYTKSYANKCPHCGGTNLVYFRSKNSSDVKSPTGRIEEPQLEGGIFCSDCDADFCGCCGKDRKSVGTNVYLTSMTDNTMTTEGMEDAPIEGQDSKEGAGKTYWDMLQELIAPIEADVQIYVWQEYCYVEEVPNPMNYELQALESVNIRQDTLKPKEGDPHLINTVIVGYGKNKQLEFEKAVNELKVNKYGPIEKKYIKEEYTQLEAKNFAERELKILQRDDDFQIDVGIIGCPYTYIGRFCLVRSPYYGIEESYYIKGFKASSDASTPYFNDLILTNWKLHASSGGASGNTGEAGIKSVMQGASQFEWVRGQSDAAVLEQTGSGDCWAMSDYLYNKLAGQGYTVRVIEYATSMSNQHRTVQYMNDSGEWADLPGYDSLDTNFHVTNHTNYTVIKTNEGV